MSSPVTQSIPFSDYEKKVRDHGLLAAIGFLVLIPFGVLVPRYLRTFLNQWWYGHAFFNFAVSGPIIFAAWGLGAKAHALSGAPLDHHKKVGYAIFGLYIAQVLLGFFIHYIRIPVRIFGFRPPQNYFHVALGLAILALANYQVHLGIYVEWPNLTGDIHPVKESAKHAWLALVIVFWALYFIGLAAFLHRQFTKEKEGRLAAKDKEDS